MPEPLLPEASALPLPEPSDATSWRLALPHTPAAVPIARALTGTALRDLGATADHDTAALLTAELVANAVAHTGGSDPIELVVKVRPGGCEIEVHDGDPVPPAGLDRPADAVCGADAAGPVPDAASAGAAVGRRRSARRGLRLVRGLSSAAGCRPTPHGKAVWFALPPLREPRLPQP
ncbi:ATP-binding protein [Streptomyces albospinus]|uniref:ATP-binding protein n=1 Tax=Streptomyces albospinus TaxID=285515 RepID=A0ABQ2UQY7_9ACTN|nr:ATP-binding protein [Streptomyces albospinus]GGU47522.1 ATP-binding protein [Streptomyces albospinus]